MKLHHFGILYMILAVALFFILDVKTSQVKSIITEHDEIERCLDTAIDDGIGALVQSDSERTLTFSKEDAVEQFFLSLYSSLNIADDTNAQQKICMYVPVILVTDEDGYYIFFSDEYVSDGVTTISKRWSDKYPYYYEDENFIYGFTLGDTITLYDKKGQITESEDTPILEIDYHEVQTSDDFATFRQKYPDNFMLDDEDYYLMKKSVIIGLLEEHMAYYVNEHNNIASQYGISYEFSLPAVDESELVRSIETQSMVVVFQGYPLQEGVEYYNRVGIAGSTIHKDEAYYIEDHSWYKIYHTADCPLCEDNDNVDWETPYYTEAEAAATGSYACETCMPESVHVPDYYK